jgi:hypothetical protein
VTTNKNTDAEATVRRWQENPERSNSAIIGGRILSGEWTTAEWVGAEVGVSHSMLSQVVTTLRAAGFKVEEKRTGTGNAKQYRVRTAKRRAKVDAEHAGITHPQLGAVLTVRALALDEGGNLVVHLTNGHAAWTAAITGHVE